MSALVLLAVLSSSAHADMASSYRDAAQGLNTAPSQGAMRQALDAARSGNYAPLNALVKSKAANAQTSSAYKQAADSLRDNETAPQLPQTPAQRTLAPAYAAPDVAPPVTQPTRAPRADAQLVPADELLTAGAVSGLTFRNRNSNPTPAPVPVKEVARPQSPAPAEPEAGDRAIAYSEPVQQQSRAGYQLPKFNADEIKDLAGSLTVNSSLSPNMALRPETNGRRNAANRLMSGMREPATVKVNETAANYQPSWYTRGLVPTGLTNYMASNLRVRGSTQGAHASNGQGLVVAPQTVRRPSSLFVGVPHDPTLRSATLASNRDGSSPDNDPSHVGQNQQPQTGGGGAGTSSNIPSVAGNVGGLNPGFFK